MAEKRGVKKNIKNDIISMNATLKLMDSLLKDLKTNLDILMKGTSGSGALWNGELAMDYYLKARKNMTNNINDYNYCAKVVENLAIQYEQAANFDKR